LLGRESIYDLESFIRDFCGFDKVPN